MNKAIHAVLAVAMVAVPIVLAFAMGARAIPLDAMGSRLATSAAMTFVLEGSLVIAYRWTLVAAGQCGGCRRVKRKVDPWS